ncbi:MAG: hypothetical protein IT374_18185 [Polyangiaceae bacterium]|nr:hypothetical protein [Polyangiaceae bacterium]
MLAAAPSLVAACGDDFESPSSVTSVRVLAVELDAPFARPGADVTLTMLVHDGGAPLGAARPLSIAWFAGCDDPDDDSPAACYPRLAWLRGLSPDELAGTAPRGDGALGHGEVFKVRVPPDLITRHAPRVGEPVPRGLSYVFFAVCAGALVADGAARPRAGVPVRCVDAETGVDAGPSRFVSGYATVRAYDDLVNHNPVLASVSVGGAAPASCDAEAACPDGAPCVDGRCALSLPRCDAGSRDDCPAIAVLPTLEDASFELDEAAASPGVPAEGELLWAAYFTTAGAFDAPVRTIFEPTDGRRPAAETAGALRLDPGFAGPMRVWSVVHDGRGGVAWAHVDAVVR